MTKQICFLLFVLLSIQGYAQTGIGTSTPHASAKLEVSSTNKGFLPPRVTLTNATDASTIPSPAEGLLVYNLGSVGLKAGYYYWNGANWATIATASSPDQTVDYVSVTLSSNQTVETGSVVLFNSNIGGNIPYNTSTGLFSLIAGKTYRLTGVIAISSSNLSQEEVNVAWKTAAGDLIGGRGEALSSNFSSTAFGSGIADVIYTPTVNTTISLTVNYGSGPVILWQNFTYANIQQIGSSATVNPWILSGTNTYTTTGNVGIGTSAPQSTLDIRGSQAQNYTATSSVSYTVLPTDNIIDLTLSGTQTVTNFTASTSNLNRILTIVNNTSATTKTISSYLNNLGTSVTSIPAHSTLIIQSTGTTWKQINGVAGSSNTVITTTNGNGSAGQLLSSNGNGTYTWVSGPMSLRVLSNPGGTSYTQSQFQTLYNNTTGLNAPDTIPIEVVNAANALNNTNYKVYLGHNNWWYTNVQSGTASNWTVFPSKTSFGANIDASGLFTYK